MKKSEKSKFDDEWNNFAEETEDLFGYDEDSLLAEMAEAEREWEQEKQDHPEEAARVETESDEKFDELMQLITLREQHREELKMQEAAGSDAEAEGNGNAEKKDEEKDDEEKKVFDVPGTVFVNKDDAPAEVLAGQRWKGVRRRKALLLAAAVCVLCLGMTIVGVAHREYVLQQYLIPGERVKVVNQNANFKNIKVSKLEDAYEEIEKNLDIKALVLGNLPQHTKFSRLVIAENLAIIELKYEGKSIYFEEAKGIAKGDSSSVVMSDRRACGEVYNFYLDQKIVIDMNKLEDDICEYSATIEYEGGYYYISGILDRNIFFDIVEGITN